VPGAVFPGAAESLTIDRAGLLGEERAQGKTPVVDVLADAETKASLRLGICDRLPTRRSAREEEELHVFTHGAEHVHQDRLHHRSEIPCVWGHLVLFERGEAGSVGTLQEDARSGGLPPRPR